MAQQKTRVVLDITWDNDSADHPANWDWHRLLVTEDDEEVTVVSAD